MSITSSASSSVAANTSNSEKLTTLTPAIFSLRSGSCSGVQTKILCAQSVSELGSFSRALISATTAAIRQLGVVTFRK